MIAPEDKPLAAQLAGMFLTALVEKEGASALDSNMNVEQCAGAASRLLTAIMRHMPPKARKK